MDLLIADASVPLASADGPPATGTPQYATDGNPVTNIPGTVWPAYWLNGLMRELMAVLVAGGVTPDRTIYTQLRDAMQSMFAPGQLLAGSGYIRLPKVGGVSCIFQWTTYSVTASNPINSPAGTLWSYLSIAFPIMPPLNHSHAWGLCPYATDNGQFSSWSAQMGAGGGTLCITSMNTATQPLYGLVWQLGS